MAKNFKFQKSNLSVQNLKLIKEKRKRKWKLFKIIMIDILFQKVKIS